ncbi:MAG: hypothetical protein ACPKPY_08375 [Nitrososphaeraceae archaeon]
MNKYTFAVVFVTLIGSTFSFTQLASASHSFELGVAGGSIPDNTHVRLNGIVLGPGEVLPIYDSSPNFISGHLLLRAPCVADPSDSEGDTFIPTVTVIAGHIDEQSDTTFVEKVPLFYIGHASGQDNSCVWHSHIPDPLNGGSPRNTDIALVNYDENPVEFNDGDVVDVNTQRVLGSIGSAPYNSPQLPGDLSGFNPVFDLNDADDENNGLGAPSS